MSRHYTPAQIPTDYAQSAAGVLWTAANLAATTDTRDPIADAVRQLDAPTHSHRCAETAAISQAHRTAGPTVQLDPLAPPHRWATWHEALTDPWQVLADAATSHSDPGDEREGLIPGHWTPAA
ncbi:hypothetical protein GTV32_22820 [Gordonia sp. SID5947]|uniref:hypothetical protein n=1 Tax=Gordonia sp. SID5947 TaxID=2690315 RepID=UPI00136C1288|nr:hypothetical protein [Gordonia sp. SID5947]MYR08969.1 hypothetical protein [Gordonia sp. SID5947]